MSVTSNCRAVALLLVFVGQTEILAQSHGSSPASATEVKDPKPGIEAMGCIEALPLLPASGTQTRQFISYDPSGGNDDGFFHRTCTRYVDRNGEHVIFDEYGPGCLYRQQMNLWQSHLDPTKMRIRYYFDGEDAPRIDMTLDQYWGRKGYTTPFTPPLSYFDDLRKNPHHKKAFNRMGVCYYPLAFKKRLKVTLSPAVPKEGKKCSDYGACWYQYTYIPYPADATVTTWQGPNCDTATVRQLWANAGQDPKPLKGNLATSKTVALPQGASEEVLNLRGTGSITSIRIRLDPYNEESFYNTLIRIFWDGHEKAAVELPIGCFFGGGGDQWEANAQTRRQVWDLDLNTLMYGYSKRKGTLYCYWPMPYRKAARIEVTNAGSAGILNLACEVTYKPASTLTYPSLRTGRFHARRTLDSQIANGGVYTVAFEERGYGKMVGLTFFTSAWSCDGDEFTYIDGSRTPQIHGDGSEDDHNAAWGGDRYYKPLWGSFTRYGDYPGVQQDYRLYLNDAYLFHKDIRITYECSNLGDRRRAETDCTVFYYKFDDEYVNIRETDRLDVGDAESEKVHEYAVTGETWHGSLTSSYDGYEKKRDYHTVRDSGRSFTGSSIFRVSIDPENDGVRLRRRVSRLGNGVQTAAVHVDGRQVTERPWYLCDLSEMSESQLWRDTDYDIPSRYTKGKKSIRVKIEHIYSRDTEKGLNEFFYWVYCFGLTRPPKPRLAGERTLKSRL